MFKRKSKGVLAMMILFYILSATYLYKNSREEVNRLHAFYIDSEASQTEILATLKEQGIFESYFSYYLALSVSKISDLLGEKQTVSSGGYLLANNLNAVEAITELSSPEYRNVSIIEGLRKEEIAERIGNTLEWSTDKIKTFQAKYPVCPFLGREGYLAAGNYLINVDADIQSVQSVMEEKFEKKLSRLGLLSMPLSDESAITSERLDEIIKIASLIQRESGGAEDMRLISGIIHNRLALGVPLQIDATLQYVKGEDGLWWPSVKPEDKAINSPFNTYLNAGLPPHPIANPGFAALAAAVDPMETDCLFYLHDKSGNIHCSTDYEGHRTNIKNYLK